MASLSKEKHSWNTKLSSAGLVYLHFGMDIISEILQTKDEESLEVLYKCMYENFVEEIDAIDNGVSQYEEGTPKYVGVFGNENDVLDRFLAA